MVTIGHIRFRNLLGREYDELARFLEQHPDQLTHYVGNLVVDLTSTSAADFIDAEHIYIVGLQHFNHFPPELLKKIDTLVKSVGPERVAKLFHDVTRPEHPNGVNVVAARQNSEAYAKSTFRTYRNLEKSIGVLPFEEWKRSARTLMLTHQAFVERSGDDELLQKAGGGLAYALLQAPSKYGMAGLQFAEELILSCLRWKPFSGLKWNLWANIYFVSHDVNSAELILWESLKRIPYQEFNSSMLAEILGRSGDFEMAVAVLEEALVYSPNNSVLLNQLAKLLLIWNNEKYFDKLASAATRSASLIGSSQNKRLLANIVASPIGKKKLETRLRQFFEETHREESWLADVGLIIAARPRSHDIAEKVFDALIALFPQSLRIANLRAKVIAKRGDQSALDRAIDICRSVIRNLGDNVYSRMQLITYLLLKGGKESIQEAVRELDRREADFGVDQHSIRLRQLISAGTPDAKEVSSVLRIGAPVFRDADKAQLLPQMPEEAPSLLRLPREIRISGELRKCEFAIRKATDQEPLAAKERLKEIIATNPTFAYAQLLAERHADWVRSDIHLDTFPAAFERALRSGDRALLARLAARYPRLEALCIVALSLFGDEAAFDQVSEALATIRETEFPPLATIYRGITSIIVGVNGPINFSAFSISAQERTRQILYSSNEASIM